MNLSKMNIAFLCCFYIKQNCQMLDNFDIGKNYQTYSYSYKKIGFRIFPIYSELAHFICL